MIMISVTLVAILAALIVILKKLDGAPSEGMISISEEVIREIAKVVIEEMKK